MLTLSCLSHSDRKPVQIKDEVRNPNFVALTLPSAGAREYGERGIFELRTIALKAMRSYAAEREASVRAAVMRGKGSVPDLYPYPLCPVTFLPSSYYGCQSNGRPLRPDWTWAFVTEEVHAVLKFCFFTGMTTWTRPPTLWQCHGVPR
jgi:hypothetical protein